MISPLAWATDGDQDGHMCGIAGYWNRRGSPNGPLEQGLRKAVASLGHRGPDDQGIWQNSEGVALGHTRLAILDLSPAGHQPMSSSDDRFVVVFNGEIYNFRELRQELEAKGHRFKGQGDTEVLLSSFREWGPECVHRFVGMFAFAVWDATERRLCLFRDRVGIKPLYWGEQSGILSFGSELKALRCLDHWAVAIDQQALGEFFQYGYISSPRSVYLGINKLPAGCWLEVQQDSAPVVRRYWSVFDAVEQGELCSSEDELTEQLDELLLEACRYRLVSDVPVGIFLSGGVDSSVVAAILQANSSRPLRTFTIGFGESRYDESKWAKRVATAIGSNHTEMVLDSGTAGEMVLQLGRIYDEPFADGSAIPTMLVSRLARADVKVALAADGGDELFGGYDAYSLVPQRLRTIQAKPRWLRQLTERCLRGSRGLVVGVSAALLGAERGTTVGRKLEKLKHVLPDGGVSEVFRASQSVWLPDEIDRLIGGYSDSRRPVDSYAGSLQEQMMSWDLMHYLPEDILTKVDRATMAVSLEGREPLLDHRVVEFAFRLPLSLRISSGGGKHLLRRVLHRYLPRELFERPKQGFSIPLFHWMTGSLRRTMTEVVGDVLGGNGNEIDTRVVRHELDLARRNVADERRIWSLFSYALWRQAWLE